MTKPGPDQSQPVEFSILIGLVSTQDRERVFEVLDAIEHQAGEISCEVIIADRCQDHISGRIDQRYSNVRRLPCPHDASLPEMRSLALRQAGGRYIVVTEDHCVPDNNWLKSFAGEFERLPADTAAVGGCVNNGAADSAFDRATYLCEYGAFAEPVEEGFTSNLPGMNIAYRHEILKNTADDALNQGFWETTVHPDLLKRGFLLYSSNLVKTSHCKQFDLRLFVTQRFLYSRYFADLRYPPQQILVRCAASLATVFLPLLLLLRSLRTVRIKPGLKKGYLSALPALLLFYTCWAAGEVVGYLWGSNGALRRLE